MGGRIPNPGDQPNFAIPVRALNTKLASATLVAGNLDEARSAYAALQVRAANAELETAVLRTTVDTLRSAQQPIVDRANLLTQYTVSQAQSNASLLAQQAGQVSPDTGLQDFIANLGLAVALGEASMPDRVISSVSASLQTYLTFNPGPDGKPTIGVRLYQPELGQPTALAKTTFEIAKVPSSQSDPAPRNLYAVLQDMQSVYTDPFWIQFVTGAPPVAPATQIVTEIAKVFANGATWTLPFLIQEASTIAQLENTLATLVTGKVPSERQATYAAVVAALASLATALNPANRSSFVAGDLYALSAALDATTQMAKTLPA